MMNSLLKSKLSQIVQNLKEEDIRGYPPGLLTGKSGIALFYMHYSKFSGDNSFEKKSLKLLLEVFHSIEGGFNSHSFCDGIGGFAWMVEHFVKHSFIQRKSVPFLDDLDEFIFLKVIRDLDNANYDFLHGSIGNVIYLLGRIHKTQCVEYIRLFIDLLKEKSIALKDGSIKWDSVLDSKQDTVGCDLSLSHGMASIVRCLCKTIIAGINIDTSIKLLNGSVQYLLSNRLDITVNKSFFPSRIKNNEFEMGRNVAWCYGEIGIAYAIYYAGILVHNLEWQNKAIDVLLHSTKINDLEIENVVDATICHGTTGTAHMYRKIYNSTREKTFKEASEFWLKESLKMAKFGDGIGGFKSWFPDKNSNWNNRYEILGGVSGIGLALISAISNGNDSWDECLLLS